MELKKYAQYKEMEIVETFEENVGYVTRTEYKYLYKGKIKCGHPQCGLDL
jgi:hypothetical protein